VTHVLVASAEPVGERMAGPAIRALELARTLAVECDVTLAAPAPSSLVDVPFKVLEAGPADFEQLAEAMGGHDVVVAQRLPGQLLRHLARLPARYVADLYNPLPLEALEAAADAPVAHARRSQRQAGRATLSQIAAADFVICASDRQRDFWLGAMAVNGLIDVDSYRRDSSYRACVDVVPFGVSERAPRAGRPVLKGVWPGIGSDDKVLLWTGGVWNWLDAITPIRATERLRDDGLPVHLVFLGVGRPALEPDRIPSAAGPAVAFARTHGLEGSCVHFNHGWLPYEERGAYLLEADLAVSAHHDHLESRFSFRTRVLDHLWAGLPTVATEGDSLADLIEHRGAGATVSAGDDEAFARTCRELLDDPARLKRAGEAARALAATLRWSETARPLIEYCRDWRERPVPRKSGAALALSTYGQYPAIARDLARRAGAGEVARRAGWFVSRAVRRRGERGR
jgi:glycosyltransferase involved in cell wall biosynthesis